MVNTFKHNLSSWIPDGLIQASQESAKEECKRILEVPSLEEIKKIPQIAPSNSNTSLLAFLGYNKVRGIYSHFVGKNVLDLGGGFGGVASNLWTSAELITVVDPVFQEKNLEALLQENIRSQEYILWLRQEYLQKDPKNSKIKSDICESQLVLNECKWWEEYSPENFPIVQRNLSYAEKLVGISNESQDVIFVNFVLSKDTVQVEKVVEELHRVLSKTGEIIVSDYTDKKNIIFLLQKYFQTELKHSDSDGIVLLCQKKITSILKNQVKIL